MILMCWVLRKLIKGSRENKNNVCGVTYSVTRACNFMAESACCT